MEKIKLSLALAHYDRHIPFFDGTLRTDKFDLDVLMVGQSVASRDGDNRHGRMLKNSEFDAAEVSLSSYLMAKSRWLPFTAIPVFPRRLFSLSMIWVNVNAGINTPQDLIGRKVGLSSFQTTLSVLTKGDLQSEYDVPWRKIHWFTRRKETIDFQAEDGVQIDLIPEEKNIGKMFLNGDLDALIMPHPPKEVTQGSKLIRRLFEDPKKEELKFFQKNGFYPIMHVIAFRDEVLDKHPEAANNLLSLFEQSQKLCREYYSDPNWSLMAWGRHLFEEERELLGTEPWPQGYKKNRVNLERFIGYSFDQGLLERELTVEELFAESTLDT
jgi:4,5-dihydroxyphthalate decarboxylase